MEITELNGSLLSVPESLNITKSNTLSVEITTIMMQDVVYVLANFLGFCRGMNNNIPLVDVTPVHYTTP